jgi:hypothetical protein
MFTNDYIMRMIEQLVWGIAKIMRLRQEQKQEEATVLLAETLRKFFNLNDRTIEELPWQSLMNLANLGAEPDMERCALLAQLIREKAELADVPKRPALYFKALNMLLSAVQADDGLASGENLRCIHEILQETSAWEPPEDSKPLLFWYYEFAGQYGKAEDMLYEWLKSKGNRKDAIQEGKAFYERLLRLPDAKLAQGNLPREEIMDGYNKLISLSE